MKQQMMFVEDTKVRKHRHDMKWEIDHYDNFVVAECIGCNLKIKVPNDIIDRIKDKGRELAFNDLRELIGVSKN